MIVSTSLPSVRIPSYRRLASDVCDALSVAYQQLTGPHSLLGLAILAGFALRLTRLDFQPLWGDEGWSFYFARMSPGELLSATAQDIHPPLYYLLLSGWLGLAGSTAVAGRLFSVIAGTLLVPLGYRSARHWFGARAGSLAAGLMAFAPLAIYYAQEVRMYGLVTVLSLASTYFFSRGLGRALHVSSSRWLMLGYVLSTTAALYTMYYAIFIPLAQLAYLLVHSRQRSPLLAQQLRRSLGAMLLVGVLYLPWVAYAAPQLIAYVQGKQAAEGYLALGAPHFVGSHLIAFSLGHLAPGLAWLGWATLLAALVAFLGMRRLLVLCYLFIPLAAGYVINLIYPFAPPYFERTLLLAAPAWWLLMGAGLDWLGGSRYASGQRGSRAAWRRWLASGLGAILLATQAISLLQFYTLPRYPDADYRGLLRTVRAHSSREDVLLASYQWQLGFYHAYLPAPHPRLYVVPGWGETWADDPPRMHADLEALMAEHPRLWFPAYQALGRLWETQAESYLNRAAFPAMLDWSMPSTKLLLYGRGQGLAPASTSPPQPLDFADQLLLEQAQVGNQAQEAGRGVLPVRLVWRQLGQGRDGRVVLRLTDATGHSWASRDSRPQGGQASFADLPAGEHMTDQHGLLIPAGTPPGVYQLRLSLHPADSERPFDLLDEQGQPLGVEAKLADVQVTLPATAVPPEALPVQHLLRANFDQRIRLLGYSLSQGPWRAGDSLSLSLFWQAVRAGEYPFTLRLRLQDAQGRSLASYEASPAYPTQLWPEGMLLHDPHRLQLPPQLPAGDYELMLELLWPDGTPLPVDGGEQLLLSQVHTEQRAHSFSAPAPQYPLQARFERYASLVGYDLPAGAQLRAGGTLPVTLYWQADEPFDRSYTVFVHVVDDKEHILGQQDRLPGNGDFPTTSWVSGEFLTDHYAVPVPLTTPSGRYTLEIGLYDATSGARLAVFDANGEAVGDKLLLTQTPIVVR